MRKGKDFIGPFPLISLRTITQFHLPLVLVQIVDDVTELQCVIIFISLDSERRGSQKIRNLFPCKISFSHFRIIVILFIRKKRTALVIDFFQLPMIHVYRGQISEVCCYSSSLAESAWERQCKKEYHTSLTVGTPRFSCFPSYLSTVNITTDRSISLYFLQSST